MSLKFLHVLRYFNPWLLRKHHALHYGWWLVKHLRPRIFLLLLRHHREHQRKVIVHSSSSPRRPCILVKHFFNAIQRVIGSFSDSLRIRLLVRVYLIFHGWHANTGLIPKLVVELIFACRAWIYLIINDRLPSTFPSHHHIRCVDHLLAILVWTHCVMSLNQKIIGCSARSLCVLLPRIMFT